MKVYYVNIMTHIFALSGDNRAYYNDIYPHIVIW